MSEVLSKLRMASTEGMKYSGDLLAVMEVLKNSTEIFRGSGHSLSNADVEVRMHTHTADCRSECDRSVSLTNVNALIRRTMPTASAIYYRRHIETNGRKHSW